VYKQGVFLRHEEGGVGSSQLQTNEEPSPGSPAPAAVNQVDTGRKADGTPRRGDRTRARILGAAEKVFGREGFHGASIVEITREAGVGLGTFYVYFPSKLEIYRHLLRSHVDDFVRVAWEATSGETDDFREIVRKAFGAFFDWIGERPGALRLLREADFVDAKLLAEIYLAPAEEFRKRLERAMDLGYVTKSDPAVLAWSLMGMTEFAVLRWLVWAGERKMDPERLGAFVELVLRAMGVEPPPPAPD
jgi:AcrR family transcriptional regulator